MGNVETPLVVTLGCPEASPALEEAGLSARSVGGPSDALAALHDRHTRALVIRTDAGASEPLVAEARQEAPLTEVFVWAPDGSAELVREALRSGAADVVLTRSPKKLANAVKRAIDRQQFLPRIQKHDPARASRFEGLVSRSARMWEVFKTVDQVAPTGASVLVLGATGTGKELLARALHKRSKRKGRFVAVNCGAIPEGLVDSELFGHERGTFTGAVDSKPGLFRQADGGTLFLDEIGNLPLASQFSLLRALQEGSVRPIGGEGEIPVDVRVVAATSTPLDDAVREGQFREDLLYRLDVIRLVIPPLAERPEDVLHLFGYFQKKLAKRYGTETPELGESFLEALVAHDWPGNVRELENMVERVVLTQRGKRLTRRHFTRLIRAPAAPSGGGSSANGNGDVDLTRTLPETIEQLTIDAERRYLEAALRLHRGRIAETAATCGISERTLLRKMRRHALDKKQFKQSSS